MKILLLLLLSLLLIACTGPNPYGASGQSYSSNEANQRMQVSYATIIELKAVQIDSQGNFIGKAAGGLLGGIAGSSVGGGRGSSAAAVAGAVVGGIIGNKTEAMYNKTNGVQITVQLTNGEVQSIVQEANASTIFKRGDHVKIISSANGTVRVIQ